MGRRLVKGAVSKWLLGLGLGVAVPALALLLLFMVLVALIGGTSTAGDQACAPASSTLPATYKGKSVGGLTPLQMSRAAAVVSQGRRMGIPDRGIVVALATAAQESRFKVYANDGKGADLASEQRRVGESMKLPHDAVGTDHGSVGVFQQQWPWWGSMKQLMDPASSARIFYEALLKVKGWESMPVTVAAQTVQSSAYPSAYADEQTLAEQLLAVLGEGTEEAAGSGGGVVQPVAGDESAVAGGPDVVDGVYVGGTADCVTAAAAGVSGTGAVVRPLPEDSGYVDQHNFGRAGGRWSSYHTGNDYSVACGTKVFAVHAGTVEFDSSQASWAGGNFVRISTGPGKLATWYAHMASRTVEEGDQVTPGQQIGTVGSEGNSTGCHLHFEVHPRGGRIYEDPVDPVTWLSKNLGPGKTQTVAKAEKLADSPEPGDLRVASFNALGHSHTKPGGNRPGWSSARSRTRRFLPVLRRHEIDVIGFQEFQAPQAQLFRKLVGDEWAMRGNLDNSVAWRRDTFALVSTRSLVIPYFHGAKRKMPVVRLRIRATGKVITVISIHNPADARGPAGRWRDQAERIERKFARAEQAAGRTVALVGDFNARASTFCTVTTGGVLTASAGGSRENGDCRPPQGMEIDWIFASSDVGFAGHMVDRSTRKKRISDHNLIVADIRLTGPVAATRGGSSDGLTVLSLDVAHGRGGVKKISEMITGSGAEVVALQRADDRGQLGQLVRRLADRLGMKYAYSPVGRRKGRQVADNAILSRYPIVDADHETLPTVDGPARGLLRATIAVDRALVDVYATHLNGTGSRKQARAVAEEIGGVSCSTVLLGSFHLPLEQLGLAGLMEEFEVTHENGRSPGGRQPAYVLHDQDTKVVEAQIMPRTVTGTRPVRATLRLSKEDSC